MGRTLLVTRIPLEAKEEDVYSVFENEDIFVDLQPGNADHDAYVTFRTVAECEAALYSGGRTLLVTRIPLETKEEDVYSVFENEDIFVDLQPGNADHNAYVTFRTVAECEAALYSGASLSASVELLSRIQSSTCLITRISWEHVFILRRHMMIMKCHLILGSRLKIPLELNGIAPGIIAWIIWIRPILPMRRIEGEEGYTTPESDAEDDNDGY
ncbi:hypothetical protein POM88_023450 [Heracleum sosnowskyi]|uniref:RRM domain-containing protein n=1 Tax=Heracleum sosnowskyi TaxID=360622 RepID=A0AAD8IHB4_9APIA|nr:hypothetical protein POM88_023450 [Heracleum sosnowskyi]